MTSVEEATVDGTVHSQSATLFELLSLHRCLLLTSREECEVQQRAEAQLSPVRRHRTTPSLLSLALPDDSFKPAADQLSVASMSRRGGGNSVRGSRYAPSTATWNMSASGWTADEDGARNASIALVARGGYLEHSAVAVFCSNHELIVRLEGHNHQLPIVRSIDWFQNPTHPHGEVTCMEFDPTADWLVLSSTGGTMFLVPVHAILSRSAFQFEELFSQNGSASASTAGGSPSPEADDNDDDEQVDGAQRPRGRRRNSALDLSYVADLNSKSIIEQLRQQALPSLVAFSDGLFSTQRTELGRPDVIAVVKAVRQHPPKVYGRVMCCLWWRTLEGVDIIIQGTDTGVITMTNLRRRTEEGFLRLKHPVLAMQLVVDANNAFKYVIIRTRGGGYWKLLIEEELHSRQSHSCLDNDASFKPPFQPELIPMFSNKPCLVQVQYSRSKGPLICAFLPQTNTLEIYDAELNRYPIYMFRLFPTTRMFTVTDEFIYTVDDESMGSALGSSKMQRILVLSREELHRVAARGDGGYESMKHAILQEFRMLPDQVTLGMLPSAPIRPLQREYGHSPESRRGNPVVNELSFRVVFETEINASVKRRSVEASVAGAEDDVTTAPNVLPLEGMYLWTSNGLYSMDEIHCPEQVVLSLLTDKQMPMAFKQCLERAESIGRTFKLDILQLCQSAADVWFEKGDFSTAWRLYAESSVDPEKLIKRYLSVNKMIEECVLPFAKQQIERVSGVPRSRLSDLVFLCYVQRILRLQQKPLFELHQWEYAAAISSFDTLQSQDPFLAEDEALDNDDCRTDSGGGTPLRVPSTHSYTGTTPSPHSMSSSPQKDITPLRRQLMELEGGKQSPGWKGSPDRGSCDTSSSSPPPLPPSLVRRKPQMGLPQSGCDVAIPPSEKSQMWKTFSQQRTQSQIEFLHFLEKNRYYNARRAISLCIETNLTEAAAHIAHLREEYRSGYFFEQLLAADSCVLDTHIVNSMLKLDHGREIVEFRDGILLHLMNPVCLLRTLASSPDEMFGKHYDLLLRCIPMMDASILEKFICFADPLFAWNVRYSLVTGSSSEFGGSGIPQHVVRGKEQSRYESFLLGIIARRALDGPIGSALASHRDVSSAVAGEHPLFAMIRSVLQRAVTRECVYRPSVVLQWAIDFKDYEVAALLCERLQLAKEESIFQLRAAGQATVEQREEKICSTLLSFFRQEPSQSRSMARTVSKTQVDIFIRVLLHWWQESLSVELLETHLRQHLEVYCDVLVYLLENDALVRDKLKDFAHLYMSDANRQGSTRSQRDLRSLRLPWILSLSLSFYADVVKLHYQRVYVDSGRSRMGLSDVTTKLPGSVPGISRAQLGILEHIVASIEQAMLLRCDIRTSIANDEVRKEAGSEVANGGGAQKPSLYVFSCDHKYAADDLWKTVLPQCRQNLQSLLSSVGPTDDSDYSSRWRTLLLSAISRSYDQKMAAQSCPICVYNHIRSTCEEVVALNFSTGGNGSAVDAAFSTLEQWRDAFPLWKS